jgi:hypothetical protein
VAWTGLETRPTSLQLSQQTITRHGTMAFQGRRIQRDGLPRCARQKSWGRFVTCKTWSFFAPAFFCPIHFMSLSVRKRGKNMHGQKHEEWGSGDSGQFGGRSSFNGHRHHLSDQPKRGRLQTVTNLSHVLMGLLSVFQAVGFNSTALEGHRTNGV